MMGIANKCGVGLRMARHHPSVGTESEGGFSSGYVLLSFQILTPSSCQEQLTTLNWTKVTPTPCMQTGENPPYKGEWLEIGYHQEGMINQNTPNPWLALKWHHPCEPTHWMGWESVSNNPKPLVVLDTQVWLPVRDGDRRSHLPAVMLSLIPEESAWQRFWRGQRKTRDFEHNQAGEIEGTRHSHHQFPYAFSAISHCSYGGSSGYN